VAQGTGSGSNGSAHFPRNREHAVVIGGSMAGLLAARVLAAHFRRVTVVERDCFPQTPTFRKGVPQSRHAHVLLTRGRTLLERMFPGLSAELPLLPEREGESASAARVV
jgi:flavin-dependent dehydrogenase